MFTELTTGASIFLFFAIALALAFEFVNGFHDTANAAATVIYTHALRPTAAVVWSGICNLIGVLLSSGAVAYGVLSLLPVELILNVGSAAGFAMVFSLLLSAICWNLGTWYLGLPASSSHALIGSMMGVGLANAMLASGLAWTEGINWAKASEVGVSLLISPVLGFFGSALFLLLMKRFIKSPGLYHDPPIDTPPPKAVRGLLILTCTGVSFAHGSNDGQKGMGLILLILIGILPGSFALNPSLPAGSIERIVVESHRAEERLRTRPDAISAAQPNSQKVLSTFLRASGKVTTQTKPALNGVILQIRETLTGRHSTQDLNASQRSALRAEVYLVTESIGKLDDKHQFADPGERQALLAFKTQLDPMVHFIPIWIKFAVAIALGLGTMIGWERIVKTVGEKIGKGHLSYAQGAAAELVAAATIGIADFAGMPVSTTHVLSSGVAGTMAANHSGLQAATLRNLLLAWVLTMPVCVFLGALLFALGLNLIASLGLH